MDQKYQHPMRDFVTASARADSVRESLAGQQSEIHSAGPEPERATVTVRHREQPTLASGWTIPVAVDPVA